MVTINLGPTIEALKAELEKLRASDDSADQKKAQFFERIGLFVWALVVNDVPPPVMGVTVFDYLVEIGAVSLPDEEEHPCDDCEQCLLDPGEDSIDEDYEPSIGEIDGVPVMPLPGGSGKDN